MKGLSILVVVCICIFSPAQRIFSFPVKQISSPMQAFAGACIKGDCYNGYGSYVFQNGNKYVGDFKAGKPHGNGILYYANGNKYLGEWLDSEKNGEGKFYFGEGNDYTGQFLRNQFHGKGTMNFANGDRFEGEWQRNQPNGQGIYTFHRGGRYEGNFANGKFNGEGTMFYKNGSKFIGLWQDNRKNGRGVFFDVSGKAYGGEWVNGKPVTEIPSDTEDEVEAIVPPDEGENPTLQHRQADEASVRIWAVVIGVAAYNHMPSLQYTDDDAYQFYAFLKSPEGGALPDGQIEILIDDRATRDNILQALRSTFLRAGKNDVVLFYYSGHGVPGAFIPVDFDGMNYRIYHDEIRQIIDLSPAKYKMVIGDACNSGSLLGADVSSDILAARSPQGMLEKFYKAFENCTGGTALLMSSKGQEVSLEDSGLRSGIFSHYVIRGLKGAADFDNDKIVTIQELSNYVSVKVSSYTAGAQTPVLLGNFDQQMPVSVVRH